MAPLFGWFALVLILETLKKGSLTHPCTHCCLEHILERLFRDHPDSVKEMIDGQLVQTDQHSEHELETLALNGLNPISIASVASFATRTITRKRRPSSPACKDEP